MHLLLTIFKKIHEENELLAAVKNRAHEQKINDAG
jgi:hypothetical protein